MNIILFLLFILCYPIYSQEYQTSKDIKKDWERLEKLLNDKTKDLGDKRKWAFTFVKEYGTNPEKKPHIYWLIKNEYIQFSSIFETKTIETKYARDIIINGNYLYLADGPGGVIIFDISSPEKPKKIKEIKNIVYAASIFIENEYLYIVQGQAGLSIWDISDIYNPINVANYYGNIEGVYAQKPLVYIVNGDNKLDILDISDTSSIKPIASYNKLFKPFSVLTKDNYIYIGDANKKLYKLKFEDNKISKISEINVEGEARHIFADDKYIYLSAIGKGLIVLDRSTLKIKGSYQEGAIEDLYISNNKFFIVSRHSVKILDAKKISSIEKIAYFEIEERGEAISAKEPIIYIANGEKGLVLLYPKKNSNN